MPGWNPLTHPLASQWERGASVIDCLFGRCPELPELAVRVGLETFLAAFAAFAGLTVPLTSGRVTVVEGGWVLWGSREIELDPTRSPCSASLHAAAPLRFCGSWYGVERDIL